MPVSLDFETSHYYTTAIDGIDVPIVLRVGRQSVEFLAKLDTGAAHCIFERKYAEMLGLDVGSGRLQRFRTVAGSFAAYQHEVTIERLESSSRRLSSSPRTRDSAGTSSAGPDGLTACASPLSTTTVCCS